MQGLLDQQAEMLPRGEVAEAKAVQAQIDRLGDHGLSKAGLNSAMADALRDGDAEEALRLNGEMKKKAKGIKKVDCTSHNINLKTWHDSSANGGKAGLRIGGKAPVRTAYSDSKLKPKLGYYDPTSKATKGFSKTLRLTTGKRR